MAKRISIVLTHLILGVLILYPYSRGLAQDITSDEVLGAVNNLRSNGGLAPYRTDDWLMRYAQEHSEYQARINSSTHVHSDGQLPQQQGVIENVAAGDLGFLTVDAIISPIWADPIHMKTMVGFTSGFMGVGVASNATTTFVTLDVRPGDSVATYTPPPSYEVAALASETETPAPFIPLVTNTPLADGSIVHVVASGDTLWQIALSYGLKVSDILALNGLSPSSNSIYVGQRLIIRLPVTATPTIPATATATATRQPTRTARPPTPTRVPTWTVTPSPSPAPTRAPFLSIPSSIDQKSIAYVLIGIGVFGLLVVLVIGFRK
jgi:LysM repeat protein